MHQVSIVTSCLSWVLTGNCYAGMPRVHDYSQLIKQLKSSPEYKESFESFTAHEEHFAYYSCHELSGTQCDICTEQKLIKPARSEGGLSRGRMRNSDSGHNAGYKPSTTFPTLMTPWKRVSRTCSTPQRSYQNTDGARH